LFIELKYSTGFTQARRSMSLTQELDMSWIL